MGTERNFDGIQFERLRRKVDQPFNDLHDELEECFYGPRTIPVQRRGKTVMRMDRTQGWGAGVYRSCWGGAISNRLSELPLGLQNRFLPEDVQPDGLLTAAGAKKLFDYLHGHIFISHELELVDQNGREPPQDREDENRLDPVVDDTTGERRSVEKQQREDVLKQEGVDIRALIRGRSRLG